jgi:branched-chain amino acid transport system permease protein
LHNFTAEFWANTVDGLTVGAIYALVALGYTMVYGVLRLINFAHSEIFMIGTFGALSAIQVFGFTHPYTGIALVGVLVVCLVTAMVASGAAAVVLERVAYRPLRAEPWPWLGRQVQGLDKELPHTPGLRSAKVVLRWFAALMTRRGSSSRLAALISAIGASVFLQEVFADWVIPHFFQAGSGRDTVGIDRIMNKTSLFHIGSGDVRNDKLIIFGASIIMMLMLDRFVNGTKLGRGIRATAQDPETAVLLGVNIDRIVMVTFLVGGLMAGAAGFFFALFYEQTKFNIGFLLGIKAFTAAVMGGIGNLRGALIGGFTLGLVENYGASIFGSQWKDVVAFTILVIILMFRPTGILGESLQRARA